MAAATRPAAARWLRLVRALLLPLGALSARLGHRFYPALGVLLAAVFLYAIAAGLTGGMKHQAYDLVMKSRFRTPAPDPEIVLIDIDEASLAAMAPQYGRWPWPRSVMAELAEGLVRQGARAVVFDITFSDPDVYHPESDRYLREVATRYENLFFPMIRLNPKNDALSELKLARLAGVRPVAGAVSSDATVAMVVPYFFDALGGLRLGTNNLYPDPDGIVRHYHVYREAYGWRIGSLPANVVEALGGTWPAARRDILLNWRGRPLVYPTVSFHVVYTDILKARPERPADEFAGKIVLIGSTAPSLFDLKPTPVAQNHPGLEILATALDNLKNGDYLSETPRAVIMLVTLLVLTALTAAFLYNVDYRVLSPMFTVAQTALLGLSYLLLNFTTVFVDLTAPFTAGLVYFFIARGYSFVLAQRRHAHPWFSTTLDEGAECRLLLVVCRPAPGTSARDWRRARRLLLRRVGLSRDGVVSTRLFKAVPLFRAVYGDMLLVHWLVPPAETEAALADLAALLEAVRGRAGLAIALHAASFRVDAEGAGRVVLQAALCEVLSPPVASGKTLVRSAAFETLARGYPALRLPDESPLQEEPAGRPGGGAHAH
jgi:CHASE2 domain-containing sensor protein